MKKRLFLHIGLHKTGTSSIQSYLSDHRLDLQRLGILYPETAIPPTNHGHHLLPWSFMQREPVDPDAIFAQINDEIATSPSDTAIISSEGFERRSSLKKIDFIAEQFAEFDTRILVYLRRQDELIESRYNQNLKMGKVFESIQSFTETMFKHGRCDFYELCEDWAAKFGRDKILVRIYTKTSNVIADFLEATGIDLKDELPADPTNPSFDKQFTALVRAVNLTMNHDPAQRKAIMKLVMKASTGDFASQSRYSLLTAAQQKDIMERCSRQNAQTARIYLGRESLFPDTIESAEFVDEHRLDEAALAQILPHLAGAIKV